MIEQLPEIAWSPFYTWQFELDTELNTLTVFRYRDTRLTGCGHNEPAFGKVFACSVRNPSNYVQLLTLILKQMKKQTRADPVNVAAAIVGAQNAFASYKEESND